MKKTPGDIIILQYCTKNHDHVLYCSWNMVCDRCNYFSFWAVFCPFTPLTAGKIKIFKKMKKTPGDIIILHKWAKNHDHMLFCSWDMVCDRCNCYFSPWAIFCPFNPPNSPKNQNFEKMKKHLEISSFYICVPKITVLEIFLDQLYLKWTSSINCWKENLNTCSSFSWRIVPSNQDKTSKSSQRNINLL